ncbi:hypothetical protein [Paraburkholderia fungorum]|uniref:hypothetical protein n=1 Tax=Paraburkholderia fungorum TaxID=134537 RepID=UPI00217E8C02|nr:hypothetical protein [Paraburkholderia fungorum]
MDRHEFFAAVAHFHHAHATALPIEHLVGCLTQHFFGHGRWAGGEIKDAHREILEAGAKNEQIAQKSAKLAATKTAAAKSAPRTRQHEFDGKYSATRSWQHFRAQKENGRLRVCANGHYRIVTANPPNPARRTACQAAAGSMSALPFDLRAKTRFT